jgi:hypothetical protein
MVTTDHNFSARGPGADVRVPVRPLTAERVRWLLALPRIQRAPRPLTPPDETALRLQLDRLFAKMRGGRLCVGGTADWLLPSRTAVHVENRCCRPD